MKNATLVLSCCNEPFCQERACLRNFVQMKVRGPRYPAAEPQPQDGSEGPRLPIHNVLILNDLFSLITI